METTFKQYIPLISRNKAWMVLDTQKFVLRQRRNRVWGCAQLNTGINTKGFSQRYRQTLEHLQTDVHFDMADVFDTKLPRVDPKTTREHELKKRALQHYEVSGFSICILVFWVFLSVEAMSSILYM